METELVRIPKKIVENEGDILDRPIMGGERIQKQIMPKSLQDQERTLDQRVVVRQVLVVPDTLALQCRRSDKNAQERQYQAAKPMRAEICCHLSHSRKRAATLFTFGWICSGPNECGCRDRH